MASDFEVEFIERDERTARFLVRGLTPALANGIRRAMISDVPTLSIDSVRMVENESVMFDEMIALRLGLTPLSAPVGEFDEDDVVTLSLEAEGPGTAYSGDLVSSDSMVEPADKNIPIIHLKDGQRLQLEADAVLGQGKDHAKFQGGVAVGYRHLQRVEDGDDVGEFEEQERMMIRGVLEEDGELIPTESFDHDLSNRYPGKEVVVEDVPGAFVFHVETDGSMPVEDLVVAAIESIGARASALKEAVKL